MLLLLQEPAVFFHRINIRERLVQKKEETCLLLFFQRRKKEERRKRWRRKVLRHNCNGHTILLLHPLTVIESERDGRLLFLPTSFTPALTPYVVFVLLNTKNNQKKQQLLQVFSVSARHRVNRVDPGGSLSFKRPNLPEIFKRTQTYDPETETKQTTRLSDFVRRTNMTNSTKK